VLEVCAQEGFGPGVALASGPARADGDKLAGVVESFVAVEVGLGGGGEGGEEEQGHNLPNSRIQERTHGIQTSGLKPRVILMHVQHD